MIYITLVQRGLETGWLIQRRHLPVRRGSSFTVHYGYSTAFVRFSVGLN